MCREISEATNSWPKHWSLKVLWYTGKKLWKKVLEWTLLFSSLDTCLLAATSPLWRFMISILPITSWRNSWCLLILAQCFLLTLWWFWWVSITFSLQAYCLLHKVLALLPLRNGIWALLLACCSVLLFLAWAEDSAFILIPASASFNSLCSSPTHKLFYLEYSLSPLLPNTFIFTWVLVWVSAHLENVSIVLLNFFGLSYTHTFTIASFLWLFLCL